MSESLYIQEGGLQIAKPLKDLLADQILPGTGLTETEFWQGFEDVLNELAGQNLALLQRRDELQTLIDHWVKESPGELFDAIKHEAFLRSIGYLVDEPEHCTANPQNVDFEIAEIAGPQLVVPVDNARFALNAANARWGSLYDAFYGTDVIPESPGQEKGSQYNPGRGTAVISRAMAFLDQAVPLSGASHADISQYVLGGAGNDLGLLAIGESGGEHPLLSPGSFRGFTGDRQEPTALLLQNNGLHIEIRINPDNPVGAAHPAGVCDVILESAISTIQDCEDSVAAVDVHDKCRVYSNWHGLMEGSLEATMTKGGKSIVRRLKPDRYYTGVDGQELTLHGRSLLLVRNVGMHMYTSAVLDGNGQAIPEGFLDAFVTVAAAFRSLNGKTDLANSRTGSIYIVKPKQHGPEEVAFSSRLFSQVEDALGLDRNTVKLGIMDEERRTTLNLKTCIEAAKDRVIFINTGFLDRTGDEIHTLMHAGPVVPKAEIKQARWMLAYEDWNVDIGLGCGLSGRAQIGKGMWAMPDNMAAMVEQKIEHPQAGANTAWVPSPTAATLHAMHYHAVSVAKKQKTLASQPARARLDDLLVPCLLGSRQLTEEDIKSDVRNNAQGILGYVVRWIDQGVGCSKVPDINDVGLMEDRATLRISSQHIGNWLTHGLISKEHVISCFKEMAVIVDQQNASDPSYLPMAKDFDDSKAFQAALSLALDAADQPNGYTEFILNNWRQQAKAEADQIRD